MRDREGLAMPPDASAATLKFLTPFALRAGGLSRFGVTSLLMSLSNRVAGLMRWFDLSVLENWRDLKRAAQHLSINESELRPETWDRFSKRKPGNKIPVSAMTGKVAMRGWLEPLLPLLVLGEDCFAGSHCAHGLGRYQLILAPH